jgi:hypothetical protein
MPKLSQAGRGDTAAVAEPENGYSLRVAGQRVIPSHEFSMPCGDGLTPRWEAVAGPPGQQGALEAYLQR